MADTKIRNLIITFFVIILALALTPAVASFATDSKYQAVQEVKTIAPLVANSTTLTYDARNDSATYQYFRITLNDTSAYGLTTVEVATNITYTVSSKLLTFKDGVLDNGKIYNATINYDTDDLTSTAIVALIGIVPLIWVVVILAVGIVAIKLQIGKGG